MATTYSDTNTSQLVINKLTKTEYENLSSHSATELYLVPEVVDDTPIENSTNPISSGGVFTALQPCTQTAPIGAILPFAGSTIPTNWMLCDGSAISRTTYAELFSVIGTTFGSGDGSTTFNIPDLRETVPVGAGTSTNSSIAAHDTYDVGQFKDDQLQDHNHLMSIGWGDGGLGTNYLKATDNNPTYGTNSQYIVFGRKGTTTHGKQLGVNYIIRVLGGSEQPEQPINYNNIPINFSDESGTYSDTPQSSDNLQSGWTLAAMFARVKKWFASLKKVAFSGSWKDLSDTYQIKYNSNYVTYNSTVYVQVQKDKIPYYTEGLIIFSMFGESNGMGIIRVKHGDSWSVGWTSLIDNTPIDLWYENSYSTSSVACFAVRCLISGNNKFIFHPLSGLRITSIA